MDGVNNVKILSLCSYFMWKIKLHTHKRQQVKIYGFSVIILVQGSIYAPDRPWSPPSLLYNGYLVFPGGKERPEREADHSPPSSAVVMKEYSYTSTPPMDPTACTEPQCL
jgi:hypothetical protein